MYKIQICGVMNGLMGTSWTVTFHLIFCVNDLYIVWRIFLWFSKRFLALKRKKQHSNPRFLLFEILNMILLTIVILLCTRTYSSNLIVTSHPLMYFFFLSPQPLKPLSYSASGNKEWSSQPELHLVCAFLSPLSLNPTRTSPTLT